jgi:hypothetical protein
MRGGIFAVLGTFGAFEVRHLHIDPLRSMLSAIRISSRETGVEGVFPARA